MTKQRKRKAIKTFAALCTAAIAVAAFYFLLEEREIPFSLPKAAPLEQSIDASLAPIARSRPTLPELEPPEQEPPEPIEEVALEPEPESLVTQAEPPILVVDPPIYIPDVLPDTPSCNGGCNRAWIKGTFGKSPSFDRAYLSVGYQHLPYILPGTWGCGTYGAAHLRDNDNWAFTLGPSFYWNPRHTCLLLGGSIFYDARNFFAHYWSQVGLTLEAYLGCWRGVINGYMPAGDRTRFATPDVYTFAEGQVVTAQYIETAIPLIEALIGRCFCPHRDSSVDVQIGVYNLSPGPDLNYIGFVGRARVDGIGPIFLEAQFTRDPWFYSRGHVGIGVQTWWRHKKTRPCDCCNSCKCYYCPRPLLRREWVIMDSCCNYTLTSPGASR